MTGPGVRGRRPVPPSRRGRPPARRRSDGQPDPAPPAHQPAYRVHQRDNIGAGQITFPRLAAGSGRAARRPGHPPGRASAGPRCPPLECASRAGGGSSPAGRGPVRPAAFICLVLRASMGANGGASWRGASAGTVRRNMTDTPPSGVGGAGDQDRNRSRDRPLSHGSPPGSQPGGYGQAPPGAGVPPGTGYGQPGYGQRGQRSRPAGYGQAPGPAYGQPGYGRPEAATVLRPAGGHRPRRPPSLASSRCGRSRSARSSMARSHPSGATRRPPSASPPWC